MRTRLWLARVLQKVRTNPVRKFWGHGSLQFLELVDDDQQTGARRLLLKKLVDPTELRAELLGRILASNAAVA